MGLKRVAFFRSVALPETLLGVANFFSQKKLAKRVCWVGLVHADSDRPLAGGIGEKATNPSGITGPAPA